MFDEDALAELTHSVREFGVLQPVVVRAERRRLRAGHGRAAAARRDRRRAWTTIPAIVRSTADDAMLRDALLENIHRAQLNPLEEAAAYQQLLEEFGATHDELAQRIGRSRPQVSNTIRLLNLPVPVQRRVAAGVISAGHARALLGLEDGDAQEELAARIVAEGLSVRATEELVALHAARARGQEAGRGAHGAADHRAGDRRARRPALRRLRHPGARRPRPAQGQDHRRVRLRRRPRAHRRGDGARSWRPVRRPARAGQPAVDAERAVGHDVASARGARAPATASGRRARGSRG